MRYLGTNQSTGSRENPRLHGFMLTSFAAQGQERLRGQKNGSAVGTPVLSVGVRLACG